MTSSGESRIAVVVFPLLLATAGIALGGAYSGDDLHGEYRVDFPELALMARQWLQDDCAAVAREADLNADCRVDYADLAILAGDWLQYPILPASTAVVGPAGGTVSGLGGASVTIPPGALGEERLISVTTHTGATSLPAAAPFVGGARFGPVGTVFRQPVTITLPLISALSPGTQLTLFQYDEVRGGWLSTEVAAVVSPDGLSASAAVMHFTDYILMGTGYDDLYFKGFRQKFFDVCALTPLDELFEDQVQWFGTHLFPLGDKKPWDFSAHYAGRGYGCYEVTGIDYVLYATRAVPDPTEPNNWMPVEEETFERHVGRTGGVAMVFLDRGDKRISDSKCGEYQLVHYWDVTVYFDCAFPELLMDVASSGALDVGEKSAVNAALICGAQGLKGQRLHWSVLGDGRLDRTQALTAADGTAKLTLTATAPANCSDGAVIITATYNACPGQEREGPTDSEISLDVRFSLAGAWTIKETANETDCDEGVNTYVYKGVKITEDGDVISGARPGGTFSGRKVGCKITGFGGGSEDYGYTYGGGELTIAPDGRSMTGQATWSWKGVDPETGWPDSCSGSSTFVMTREK